MFTVLNEPKVEMEKTPNILTGYHYSDIPKNLSTLKLQVSAKDPRALYIFPKNEPVGKFEGRKYAYEVVVDMSKAVDISNQSFDWWIDLVDSETMVKYDELDDNIKRSLIAAKKDPKKIYDFFRLLIDDGDVFAGLFLSKNYDVLIDSNGVTVMKGEPQIVILNKDKILSFSEIKTNPEGEIMGAIHNNNETSLIKLSNTEGESGCKCKCGMCKEKKCKDCKENCGCSKIAKSSSDPTEWSTDSCYCSVWEEDGEWTGEVFSIDEKTGEDKFVSLSIHQTKEQAMKQAKEIVEKLNKSESSTKSNQGLHYSDPMVWQAALEVINGTETEAELELLAETVTATKYFEDEIYYYDEDADEEYTIHITVGILPAEPDVGISQPYIDELIIEKIVPANATELVGKEFNEMAKKLGSDEEWMEEAGSEVMDRERKKEESYKEEYKYAQEQKWDAERDDRLLDKSESTTDLKQDAMEKLLKKMVLDDLIDFSDVAQIVFDSGLRTQGMDGSEIYCEAAHSMAVMNEEELIDFASVNLGQEEEEFKSLIKDIPFEANADSVVTSLPENMGGSIDEGTVLSPKSEADVTKSIDEDLGIDYADEGPWRSYQLIGHGKNEEEFLENASIFEVGQDGQELGSYDIYDATTEVEKAAMDLIIQEFSKA